jgi:AcrR family transcriptional regulator
VADSTKNKILNSAECIALRDGVAHLTIDAVAAEAGLSKGGVLYNFATKEALIQGMVDRLIEQTDGEIARRVETDPLSRGRMLRAYLGVTFPERGAASERVHQIAAVLLSAVMTNPNLLEPVRRHSAAMQRRLLADELDERVVLTVRFAADGMWLADMLGMPGPKPAARKRLIQHLYSLTRE